MKNGIRKILGTIALTGIVGIVGIVGCKDPQSTKEIRNWNWNGPILMKYEDKDRDGKIDNVKINFVSSFTAGCMGYERSPTELEVKNFQDSSSKYGGYKTF